MTTTVILHERDSSSPDFREPLRRAAQCAVSHTPEDPLKNGDAAERYRDAEDDHVLSFMHIPSENQVFTTKPAEYIALLQQAAEVIDGITDLTAEDRDYIKVAATHELTHGEAAADFGNTETTSYYGVEFVRRDDGSLDFWPYHFIAGPLKKVHHAWCAAAPDDRSTTDMDIVRGLGYGEDIEELRVRAFAEPPVDEGWERVITQEDIVAILQRLALKDE